jgi:hypothetical protein
LGGGAHPFCSSNQNRFLAAQALRLLLALGKSASMACQSCVRLKWTLR